MPNADAFISSPDDAFINDVMTGNIFFNILQTTEKRSTDARVADQASPSGYWDGIGRAWLRTWGYQKIGNHTSAAGVTNRYAIQGPLQYMQSALGLDMTAGSGPPLPPLGDITGGTTLMQDGTAGLTFPPRATYLLPTGVFQPHGKINPSPGEAAQYAAVIAQGTANTGGAGKPGGFGWRVRLKWRSHFPSTGVLADIWVGRRAFHPDNTNTPEDWLTDTNNDGQAEYTKDAALRDSNTGLYATDPPAAWQVVNPPVGEWVEKVFLTNASYPYLQVEHLMRMVAYPQRFSVPQQAIEEETTEFFGPVPGGPDAWQEVTAPIPGTPALHQPVFDFEVVFHRRAAMVVLYLVKYGSTQLLPTLPAPVVAALYSGGSVAYNAACQAARTAALAAHGLERLLVQLIAQPYVLLSVTEAPPGTTWTASIAANRWVDFEDAAVTSNLKVGWRWDFGDGQIALTPNAQHYYANCGLYVTSLEVTDNAGDQYNSAGNYRVLLIVPDVNLVWRDLATGVGGFAFVGVPESFNPNFNFHNLFVNGTGWVQRPEEVNPGGPGESFLWDFGDGSTSTAKFPTHTYASAGVKVIKCTVSAPNGWGVTQTTQISVLP